ncbi:hypothetical protein BHE74_00023147 [Ensete ventricosum]|nr:hypothetical protein BHE74_00023147 [Ensete ventricosum]RZS06006.1 hypothetical protein BHM03_00036586 [Ensete ventricosum]
MRLGTRQECIGSSPRVSRVYHNGTKEFVGRRPRLTGRLSRVAERLGGSWEGLEVDVFAEGIGKLARNTLGDHRRKTVRLIARDSGGCRNVGVRSLSLVVMFHCNL